MFLAVMQAMENNPKSLVDISSKYIASRLIDDAENNRESKWFIQANLPEEIKEVICKALPRYFSNKLWAAFAKDIFCKELDCGDEVGIVAISDDNRFIIASLFNESIQIFDMYTADNTFITPNLYIDKVLSNDNKLAALLCHHNIIRLSNEELDTNVRIETGYPNKISQLTISNDNQLLVVASCNIAKIWNTKTGALIKTRTNHTNIIAPIAISRDNTFAVILLDDGTATVWSILSDEYTYSLIGHTNLINSVAISNDNTFIVTGSADKTAKIWDTQTGQCTTLYLV